MSLILAARGGDVDAVVADTLGRAQHRSDEEQGQRSAEARHLQGHGSAGLNIEHLYEFPHCILAEARAVSARRWG